MWIRAAIAAVAVAIVAATPAGAAAPHTVAPGETLWSIAAANNLTTRTVAVYNGLSEDAHVIEGQTIQVPTVDEGAAALAAVPAPAAPDGRAGADRRGARAAGRDPVRARDGPHPVAVG